MTKKNAVSGKNSELVRHFASDTIFDLLLFLEEYPLLEPEKFGYEVTLISDITRADFEAGREKEDPSAFNMRNNNRINLSENCLMEPLSLDSFSSKAILGKTVDYSKEGLSVEYVDTLARQGSTFHVSVKALGKFRKDAQVVWTKPVHRGMNVSGLKWIE